MAKITKPTKPEIQEQKVYLQYITILKHRKNNSTFSGNTCIYWIQSNIKDELRTDVCLEEIYNLEYSQG